MSQRDWGPTVALPPMSYVNMVKSHSLSVPHFPYLQNGDKNITYYGRNGSFPTKSSIFAFPFKFIRPQFF